MDPGAPVSMWTWGRVHQVLAATLTLSQPGRANYAHPILKPFQNKKGQKKIPGAEFSLPFSQLPAVKKDTENCAPGNFFGPSYFVTTLAMNVFVN